jgi:hypothetical protein
MQRIIKDVADDDLAFWQSALELDGFTVEQQIQDGGIKSLIGTKPGDEIFAPDGTGLAWGQKVSPAFRQKLRDCCARLQVNPDFLMAAMAFETGETFSPSTINARSRATGLIQFMPTTAAGLGTSIEQLAQMTAERQLDFVEKHFQPFTGKLQSLEDTYMAILLPAAIRESNSFVLFRRGTVAYDQNRGLDANGDGLVTKDEAAQRVRGKLDKGRQPQFVA